MIGIWKDPMIGTNLLFIIRIDAPSQLGKGSTCFSSLWAEGCMQPMNLGTRVPNKLGIKHTSIERGFLEPPSTFNEDIGPKSVIPPRAMWVSFGSCLVISNFHRLDLPNKIYACICKSTIKHTPSDSEQKLRLDIICVTEQRYVW